MLSRDDAATATVPPRDTLMTAVATPSRPKRPKRAPTRIDWNAARAFGAKLGTERTIQQIADKFPVSRNAVKAAWKRYDWDTYFAEYDARVEAAVARDTILTGELRAVQNAKLRDLSGAALLRKVSTKEPELEDHSLVRVWEKSGHDVRLDSGTPTERVEQLHRVLVILPQLLGDVLSGLLPLIPLGEHERAVQVFEGTVGRYSEQLALPAENADGELAK